MTEPTDAELSELADAHTPSTETGSLNYQTYARAALAKWGTPPAVAGEPVAWYEYARKKPSLRRLVFERTSRKDLRTAGWVAEPLYATPQPTQAQAGAVPLTAYEIHESIKKFKESENLMGVNHIHVARAIEHAHGIGIKKGDGHGLPT